MNASTAISVQKEFCGECTLALAHFLRKVQGIESVVFEPERIVVEYDDAVIPDEEVRETVRRNVEALGYRTA